MLASRAILKRLRKRANVQLLMDLAPLRDAWHGAQAQPAASGGLVQYVFRSPARNPARQSSRRGSCAAPLSEKRSSLCYTLGWSGNLLFGRVRDFPATPFPIAPDCGCGSVEAQPAPKLGALNQL